MRAQQNNKEALNLSRLGIGCWSFGGGEGDYWGAQDQKEVEALVETALDLGITYFDTAEMYNEGRSEEALGRALKSRRGEAIIGSKVLPNHASPELLRRHCEASLRRLGIRCDRFVHAALAADRIPHRACDGNPGRAPRRRQNPLYRAE